MGNQMTFKRTEIKYMLTEALANKLENDLFSLYMIPDEHKHSKIYSLYYDTPNNLLIRRSMEHPLYKEKLRLRSYKESKDDDTVFIELKKKYDGIVYKRRIEAPYKDAIAYLNGDKDAIEETQIRKELDYFLSHYSSIRPSFLITYERDAFYGANDHDFRITFDRNINWRNSDLSLKSSYNDNNLLSPGKVLMEIKIKDSMPMWLVDFLTKEKIYKTSFSKYASAYSHNEVLETLPYISFNNVLQSNLGCKFFT